MSRRAFTTALFLALASAPSFADVPRNMPVRTIEHNVLVSPGDPKLTLHIAKQFAGLPALDFPIEDLTWAQRRIFVDTSGGEVRRMVIVQFEHVQDGSPFRFRYPSKPPKQWGAQTYRFGTYDYDADKELALNPGKEQAQMRRFFAKQMLHAGRYWRTLRLARVTNLDGMSEVIVFYMEALPASTILPTPADDSGVDIPRSEAAQLWARFEKAVSVSDDS